MMLQEIGTIATTFDVEQWGDEEGMVARLGERATAEENIKETIITMAKTMNNPSIEDVATPEADIEMVGKEIVTVLEPGNL